MLYPSIHELQQFNSHTGSNGIRNKRWWLDFESESNNLYLADSMCEWQRSIIRLCFNVHFCSSYNNRWHFLLQNNEYYPLNIWKMHRDNLNNYLKVYLFKTECRLTTFENKLTEIRDCISVFFLEFFANFF